MLAMGVPLVLCVAVLSAVGLQPGKSAAPEDNRQPLYDAEEQVQHSMSSRTMKITVAGQGFSRTYTEASEIQAISGALTFYGESRPQSGCFADEYMVGEAAPEETESDDGSGKTTGTADGGYTITLMDADGGQTAYYLAENILQSLSEDAVYVLTEEQAEELRELLGLTNG